MALSSPISVCTKTSATDTTAYSTGIGNPGANALVVVYVNAERTTVGPDVPSIANSPWGLTFTRDARGDNAWTAAGTTRRAGWIFYAATTSDPGDDTFDVAFANTVIGCEIIVVAYTGADLSGDPLDALVQCTVAAGSSNAYAPTALNAAGDAENRSLAFYAINVTLQTIVEDSGGGWAELVELSHSTPTISNAAHYIAAGFDTTPTATPSAGNSTVWGAWGLEIKAAAAGAAPTGQCIVIVAGI